MQLGCSSSLELLFPVLTGVLVLLSLVYKAFNSFKKKKKKKKRVPIFCLL
jgi:hypothetical protein